MSTTYYTISPDPPATELLDGDHYILIPDEDCGDNVFVEVLNCTGYRPVFRWQDRDRTLVRPGVDFLIEGVPTGLAYSAANDAFILEASSVNIMGFEWLLVGVDTTVGPGSARIIFVGDDNNIRNVYLSEARPNSELYFHNSRDRDLVVWRLAQGLKVRGENYTDPTITVPAGSTLRLVALEEGVYTVFLGQPGEKGEPGAGATFLYTQNTRTLENLDQIAADTRSGSFALFLPNPAPLHATAVVFDVGGNCDNEIVQVYSQNHPIDGVDPVEPFDIDLSYGQVTFVSTGSDWRVNPDSLGAKGDPGATGAQGPAGPQGPKGDPGADGADGNDGATGATGPEGPQGPKGDQGTSLNLIGSDTWANISAIATPTVSDAWVLTDADPAAPQFGSNPAAIGDVVVWNGTAWANVGPIQGPVGPQGPQGDPGADGADGATGPKGDTGDTGPAGPQGVKGDDGAQGPPGATGPKGNTGATGPQGPQGAQGPKGDPGEDGSDVNLPFGSTFDTLYCQGGRNWNDTDALQIDPNTGVAINGSAFITGNITTNGVVASDTQLRSADLANSGVRNVLCDNGGNLIKGDPAVLNTQFKYETYTSTPFPRVFYRALAGNAFDGPVAGNPVSYLSIAERDALIDQWAIEGVVSPARAIEIKNQMAAHILAATSAGVDVQLS